MSSPTRTATLFDDVASPYDRFTSGLRTPRAEVDRWVAAHVVPGVRALDVGCGTGRYAELLAERGAEVLAVDPASRMLAVARETRAHPRVRYEQRSLHEVDAGRDGPFDLVLAFSAVLHIGSPEHTLGQLRDLVSPGGVLLVVEPLRPQDWGEQGWHAELAFASARAVWDTSGDVAAAAAALELFLHPSWSRITTESVPMTAEQFRAICGRALPGGRITTGLELGSQAVAWTAPLLPGDR